MHKLPLFYYTSSVLVVDDDELFLKAVSNLLNPCFQVKTLTVPDDCLALLKHYHSPLSQIMLLRGCSEHEHHDTNNHSIVDLNVLNLSLLKDIPQRTEEISVLLVDYNMPRMNGIELCQKLRSLPIKKILLTGEADHKEAVAAFNDKIIDCFLRKDSPSLADDIKSYVHALSQQYYHDLTLPLLAHLEADHQTPLSDPVFIEFFQEWCRSNTIKEYALIDKYGSFLVINDKNEIAYFVTHTDKTLNTFVELNDDVSEAVGLLDLVQRREQIPFFGIGRESWELTPNEWKDYFYIPEIIEGREKYYWKIIS